MKIALLTTDNRHPYRQYDRLEPFFGTAPEALLQGFAQLPEVEVHVVSCIRQPVTAPEKIAPNIFFHSVVAPKIGWLRTLYQGCIRATRKKLREIQPDIVHGQGTELDCGISGVFSGFPNVLTIHGNMRAVSKFYQARPGSFLWLAARLENFTLPRTAGVFCNSTYTRQLAAPRARKTWLVPNAVRLGFFNTPIQPRPPGRPVLLNVGVLQPYKRQLELLAAARNLHQRGLQFEMQFAGELTPHTAYGREFERQLRSAQAAGYARHIGLQSTPQLIATMDAASALVHFSAEESFGLVVAEALARNRKFFGTATGGVADIATGVDGAELFSDGDFTALENGIARWLEADAPLPQSAAGTMRQRYHPEIIARRHLEIYREVLQTKMRNLEIGN
jgi:glycosyltransferase involved in cell wall biosynthesis